MLSSAKGGNAAYANVQGVYSHVYDPNERRRLALAEVDRARFSWYHARLVVVTGVGFFTDAYSLFAINVTIVMLGMAFWHDSNAGVIPHGADTAIKVATSVGTIFGQVVFGYLADVLGRKRMYGVELVIIITATLGQSLCAPSKAISFVGIMVFWRVLMGVGVGGDYPMSGVITAEFASTKWRGAMIGAVFAMQGLGQFAAALVALIVTVAYKDTLQAADTPGNCTGDCLVAIDTMWRIIIGFGGIPGWFALYYRLTIPETPRYTFDVLQDVERATADASHYTSGKLGQARLNDIHHATTRAEMRKYRRPRPSLKEALSFFSRRRNALHLLGTAGSWFFLDIAFFGLGLNSGSVLSAIGYGGAANPDPDSTLYHHLHSTATGQLILICAGAIPGYWLTVALIDTLGRRPIQLAGFAILTLLFATIGFLLDRLSTSALLALYILAHFFFNFGPNATTFIVPAELYPTRLRATAHGVSAAAGKLGAVIAQVAFAPLVGRGAVPGGDPHPCLGTVMQVFALFMFCGLVVSLLVPETKRRSLPTLLTHNIQPKNIPNPGVSPPPHLPTRLQHNPHRLRRQFLGKKLKLALHKQPCPGDGDIRTEGALIEKVQLTHTSQLRGRGEQQNRLDADRARIAGDAAEERENVQGEGVEEGGSVA
ncbi:phosphate permease [Pseudovirgaria hyperparasitica]|uniref:Phosphate permease n=1 Tax=Pseudovirgaria hyperparasitica TaxID=470096 RepID=A0A6A6W428_9PEZI|nr:phosphate permease [Pseudovirgaria hyperparasitica]KAF2757373.1 phosphate permease [Pseudovirgaria hyperparasitica]